MPSVKKIAPRAHSPTEAAEARQAGHTQQFAGSRKKREPRLATMASLRAKIVR